MNDEIVKSPETVTPAPYQVRDKLQPESRRCPPYQVRGKLCGTCPCENREQGTRNI